jgi:hypothetical protein
VTGEYVRASCRSIIGSDPVVVSAGSAGLTARPVEDGCTDPGVVIRRSDLRSAVLHGHGIRSYAARRDR